jgi:HEAT repeat protein
MRYFYSLLTITLGATIFIGQPSVGFCQESSVSKISAEAELIAILKGEATGGDKALACKRLAVYGSAAAAPELGKLLTDEKLASWARIALEAIPGKESNEALRSAAGTLKGRLLVGVINSLGVRRDKEAIALLTGQLKSSDVEVASAAAVALGSIGGDTAASELAKAIDNPSTIVRSAVAEGCILCAEQSMTQGNSKAAMELYDLVRKSELPKQRLVEATRGAILARGDEGIPLLLEQLRSEDKPLFDVGLWTARELPGKNVVVALLDELKQAAPEKSALIVQALADRKGTLDLPTIIQVASSGPRVVRIAAMSAISRVGDASCVEPLLKFAMEKDADLLLPAKEALKEIQDDAARMEILNRLPSATGDLQQLLIEVVGLRRIEATNELVKALESASASIRKAALESLGSTLPQKDLAILIKQAVTPKNAEDTAVARLALKTAAVRMPDREACASVIADAMKDAPTETKVMLLEVLGSVTGAKALEAIGAAGKDADPQLKDIATRILGDWLTLDAAPVLIDLASSGPADKYQVRALRGYIRMARQFVMSDKDRVVMCTKALAVAKQPAERKLTTEIFARYPSVAMLKLAIETTKDPELRTEATQAAQTIATKLGDKKEAREMMSKAGITIPN